MKKTSDNTVGHVQRKHHNQFYVYNLNLSFAFSSNILQIGESSHNLFSKSQKNARIFKHFLHAIVSP